MVEPGTPERPYLVEEYVDGVDLGEYERRRRAATGRTLPLWAVASVCAEAARGLHEGHQAGVIHRDAVVQPSVGTARSRWATSASWSRPPRTRCTAPRARRRSCRRSSSPARPSTGARTCGRSARPPFALRYVARRIDRPRGVVGRAAALSRRAPRRGALPAHPGANDGARPGAGTPACSRHATSWRRPRRSRLDSRRCASRTACTRSGRPSCASRSATPARVDSDAIVNSANCELTMRSGTGEAIRLPAATRSRTRRSAGRAPSATACPPAPGPCPTPASYAGRLERGLQVARATHRAVLLAAERGYKRLAFPAIATGQAACRWSPRRRAARRARVARDPRGPRARARPHVLADAPTHRRFCEPEAPPSSTTPPSTPTRPWITITAFERSPDGGKGLARDTRVRWALEEVGQPYEVRLVSFRAMKEPAHLALHPFGQIPTYEEGDLALFETGAIVFHIAERHAGLLPDDANARARAITWMFAALNTVEPPILELATARLLEGDKPWSGAPASGRGSRPRPAGPTFRSPGRCRLARWCVQRGRPDDGVGAAQVESIGHSGRISEPGRLCRPRRSAARLTRPAVQRETPLRIQNIGGTSYAVDGCGASRTYTCNRDGSTCVPEGSMMPA